jgi:hypothetical protein
MSCLQRSNLHGYFYVHHGRLQIEIQSFTFSSRPQLTTLHYMEPAMHTEQPPGYGMVAFSGQTQLVCKSPRLIQAGDNHRAQQ